MIIYKVTNCVNGKIYIGQTIQPLGVRWKSHTNKGCALYRAIKKYGVDSFTVEQIDTATSRDELDAKEIYWIGYYDCIAPKGYNLTSGGIHYEISDDTRKKHRDYWLTHQHPCKGRTLSDEHKEKLRVAFTGSNNPQYGKKMSSEHKERLRKINTGRKPSDETRKRMSESRIGEKNHFYGKTHTPETRNKISESRKKYVGVKHPRARAVMCLETGVVYPYIRKASQETGVHETHITSCCRGKLPHAGGFHWEYVNKD